MDDIRAFFNNPDAPSVRVRKLRGPLTGGQRITNDDPINALDRRQEHRQSVLVSGTDYAHEIKARETAIYLRNDRERPNYECFESGRLNSGCLDSLEHLTTWGSSAQNIQNEEKLTEEAMNEVYSRYSFQMKEDTKNLAINAYRDEILNRIKAFPVVIIEGPTGCGKTTQVPQWILDDAYNSRKPCKIVVTQPRKIAAISIARRVAQERGWDVGGLVGYQIGLENKTSSDTRIHYVTTGVLLQKLVSAKNMNEYTHIILDEVHERGQEMDFLMLVVKKFLYTVSPLVRVILMSATFNCETFADYFLIPMADTRQQASFLRITVNEPTFTVKTFYLDALKQFGQMIDKVIPKANEAAILPEMHHLVINLIDAFEKIDKKEEYEVRSEADLPSVLIFLPGIYEIEELYACLMDTNLRKKVAGAQCADYDWWVLPLHSTITADEQVRVFKRAPPGHRKIILATNIAESSITVPDIKYVIDYCLMKILVADQNTNFTSLQLTWASKTNCEQRAGRAGRVRDGRVFRLITEKAYKDLQQECTPEIIRCPLERLVLIAKMLDMGQPSEILALAMDPPDISNIHRTILVLKEAGALKKTLYGEWSESDGDITYLGRVMAKLPLDVKISKLIMLGHIFGCLEESIIMAAGMSVKNVFSSPFRERLNAYNSKLTWADGSTSDCIAILNVYKVWTHLRQQKYFKQPGNSEANWARRFYVQIRSLRELDDMVKELRMRLSREGIDPKTRISPWNKHEQPVILKVILAGAFYPQYFVQVSTDEARERDAVKLLGGLDPRTSVYLRGFPDGQPGEVYATAIKNIVKKQIGDEPRVTFDKNGRKVYLTFQENQDLRSGQKGGDPTIPGQVVLPVYKAIKARHLKMDIRIPLLPIEKATALAEAIAELRKHNTEVSKMVPRLPEIDDTHFPLQISQLINVGRFWVQYADQSTASELQMIQFTLNRKPLLAFTHSVAVDTLVAAPYSDANGTLLFRARVTRLLPKEMVEVFYIDYGSMGRVGTSGLKELPEECRDIPPLAMQCVLSSIAPAPLLHAHAQWSPNAERLFTELVSKGGLLGKIYSVAHGVTSIELLAEGGKTNVNKVLLEKGFAVPCEESYDSKLNHDIRQTATELNLAQKRALNKEQVELAFNHLHEIEPPNYRECISDACLNGPDSPLEASVHNLMYASREKMVSIEWSSVNSVLLDTEPQEVYERLLVAADVGQNELSSRLTLRHTTLLPNIRGLPAIISLLFCPEAELRRADDKSRYVSVLCGLGSSESGAPRFPEHDLLVNIDADLSVSDIGLINHIRYLMDYVMFCNEGEDIPSTQDEFRPRIPAFIRDDLMKLLQKRRKRREPQCVVNAWEWKSIPEDDLLEINIPDMLQKAVVYPPHTPIEIDELPREVLLAMMKENEELKMQVARTAITSSQLVCKLCATPPMPVHAMRIHLCSNAHLDKEEDFRHLEL
ncbi:probable ATP-dependent RNA helicase spindle-E [Maniola jurtina]|uniref:probable ATP-dependent RNA helicase spindle-E n=1 Tax=Maniola jurtina TaxID=191418 RepID=UPI001E68BEC9|nr:probable ATP-dependent RNA helicase spindle-E [Maniola jurtina]